MENLTITKEKVLEAASKCSTARETLKVLFPEAFEPKDNNAFIKNFDSRHNDYLRMFSRDAFGSEYSMQILISGTPDNRPDLKGRALYISTNYIVKTGDASGGGTYIEIIKKESI